MKLYVDKSIRVYAKEDSNVIFSYLDLQIKIILQSLTLIQLYKLKPGSKNYLVLKAIM